MLNAVVVAALLGAAAAASEPQIAQQHSRFDSTLIKLVNGQTRSSSGPSNLDGPHNRTRFVSKEQGVTIITLYNLGKEFGIQGSQCQYCPTNGDLTQYGPAPGAAFIGSSSVGGVACDVWQSNVTLGPTVMQVRALWGAGEAGAQDLSPHPDPLPSPAARPRSTTGASRKAFVSALGRRRCARGPVPAERTRAHPPTAAIRRPPRSRRPPASPRSASSKAQPRPM